MSPLGTLRSFILLPILLIPASQDGQRAARSRLISRDYAGAIQLLDKLVQDKSAQSDTKGLDRLRFFLARALFLAGKRQEAEKGYRELLEKHAQSSYRALAEFGLAECLEEPPHLLGRHADAAVLDLEDQAVAIGSLLPLR